MYFLCSVGLTAILATFACGPGALPASQHVAGPLADTWSGHGTTWRPVTGEHPSPRYAAALAFDAERKQFVLFGGQSGSVSYDDTWTFDGTAWKPATPAHRPPPRRDAAMAYDPSLGRIVLYGGLVPDGNEGSEAADTWTWDGNDWSHVGDDNHGPGHRDGARLVTAGDGVILFGGHISNVSYFGDAWSFDGKTWTRTDRDPGPAGRGDAAVGWNPLDSSLLVYGGLGLRAGAGPGNIGVPLTDGWSLKDGTWSRLSDGPPPLYDANTMWDERNQAVVLLFGMSCPRPRNDAWVWSGGQWIRASMPVPARWGAALARDADGNVLVFGGDDEAGC